MSFVLVGLNHKTAPVEIREKVHFSHESDEAHKHLLKQHEVDEGYILSTCNRVEVCVATKNPAEAEKSLKKYVAGTHELNEAHLSKYLYTHKGVDAVTHMFRVASSLDSMVVGESQILGQVKEAYRKSKSAGTLGPKLHRFYDKAFSVAKRVRAETSIGTHPISIASVAVDLSQKIFDHLENKVILLMGAGEMVEAMFAHLQTKGASQFYLTNRSKKVSDAYKYIPLEEFPSYLDKIDMIFASTSAPNYLLTQKMIEASMSARKNRPLFCIDISVPRNIDPQIHKIDNVYLYDIDDLEIIVKENFKQREYQALRAEKIVEEEALRFYGSLHHPVLGPTLQGIQNKADHIYKVELEELKKYLPHLNKTELKHIEKFTKRFITQFLHDPVQQIKDKTKPQGDLFLETIKKLFKL